MISADPRADSAVADTFQEIQLDIALGQNQIVVP